MANREFRSLRSGIRRENPGCGAGLLATVHPCPPFGSCWAWGRPVPGIPELALKEAARQEALLPSPGLALHSRPVWGNAMGLCALRTFLWGLWLLAGMGHSGLGRGRWS